MSSLYIFTQTLPLLMCLICASGEHDTSAGRRLDFMKVVRGQVVYSSGKLKHNLHAFLRQFQWLGASDLEQVTCALTGIV